MSIFCVAKSDAVLKMIRVQKIVIPPSNLSVMAEKNNLDRIQERTLRNKIGQP